MHPEPAPAHRRILLAFDQARSSTHAATEAIRRAAADRAELVVLSVLEPHALPLPAGSAPRVDQERDRLTSAAQLVVREARDAGVAATFLIWEGDPAEAIVEASQAEEADLIVLGSRARTSLRRLILGSVSSEVVRRAICQVMVVPG
ncbi:MAG TPA: universal stress protein [Candidatus Limnocylindrales bacterium]|nr:universal stress protein [Candidatus Limnocylindrales bacterium]